MQKAIHQNISQCLLSLIVGCISLSSAFAFGTFLLAIVSRDAASRCGRRSGGLVVIGRRSLLLTSHCHHGRRDLLQVLGQLLFRLIDFDVPRGVAIEIVVHSSDIVTGVLFVVHFLILGGDAVELQRAQWLALVFAIVCQSRTISDLSIEKNLLEGRLRY